MSLKAFHVFFITVSTLLCFGFGGWCFRSEFAQAQPGYTAAGVGAFVVGLGLIVYEVNFLKKFRNTP